MKANYANHRTLWILVGVAASAIALVATIASLAMTHHNTTSGVPVPAKPMPAPPTAGWNTTAERALASRPMLALPPQDAQPHPLTSLTAGPAISLPQPSAASDRWIPTGFPGSAVGAVAQLKALDENGMAGGDPDVYARAYRQLSLPGAPDPRSTGLASVLTNFRAAGGLPDTGAAPDLSVTYQVTEGLIKGVADGGRYAVVCVLGELTVEDRSQTVAAGVGDCQALRWTGIDWRISPGVMAAPAPCAWPGTVESVDAGYRELT